MTLTKLYSRRGDIVVATVLLPPFAVEPSVIHWRDRCFVRQPGRRYLEAVVWIAPIPVELAVDSA